ncbi:PsiF family protein [Simplicispira suum]|uniref:Phosphate starvation-inducible protein PsiF n=1 Tax=Simplicispira suum TaxID=2109915 RepID=A0A2S0MYT5_9BURK|nr:PsiF family protein [Simplicispira suum]AVO40861.1 phosphate starvation-inducible protein PsiF [Simplicispira suum]
MKKFLALTTLGFACAFGTAWAADAPAPVAATPAAAKAPTKQQSKMKTCNADAKGMKGDERKAFMKTCLSNKPEAEATQQSKMKTCNAEAAGKKGAERKAFMSECLKK